MQSDAKSSSSFPSKNADKDHPVKGGIYLERTISSAKTLIGVQLIILQLFIS